MWHQNIQIRRAADCQFRVSLVLASMFLLMWGISLHACGQDPATPKPDEPAKPAATETSPPAAEGTQGAKDPPGLKRLMPKYDVWIDPKRKLVVVQGRVCLRQGALEMFACPKGTKEHESVVALNCKAWHVHAALMAVGAKPIHPVKFDPEYVPAKGTEIAIDVLWRDSEGKNQRMPAQHWVKDTKGNVLKYSWVFGGSRFYKDEMTGQEIYLAEDGDLICVSNFTTATMDLPIESSADAGGQLFLANTKNIPKLDTVVRLVLRPVLKKNGEGNDGKPDGTQGEGVDDKTKDTQLGGAKANDSPKKPAEPTAKENTNS